MATSALEHADGAAASRRVIVRRQRGAKVHLAGLGPVAGPVAAAARAQSGEAVDEAAIDTAAFRFATMDRINHPMFVPGAACHHDVPALVALGGPGKLRLAGGADGAGLSQSTCAAAGKPDGLSMAPANAGDAAAAAAKWLKE